MSKYKVSIITTISGTSEAHNQEFYEKAVRLAKTALPTDAFEEPVIASASDTRPDILGRIVRSIYDYDLVIADVTDGNPNVAFEVGLRAAFDNPFVLYRAAESKSFSDFGFQFSEPYPEDFRYPAVEDFQSKLLETCLSELKKKTASPQYSPFLSAYTLYDAGQIPLNTKEVSETFSDLNARLSALEKRLPKGKVIDSDAIRKEDIYYHQLKAVGRLSRPTLCSWRRV